MSSRKKLGKNVFVYWAFTFVKKGYYFPHRFLRWIAYFPTYLKNRSDFNNSARQQEVNLVYKRSFPVYVPYSELILPNRHYWFQDIWAARQVDEIAKKCNDGDRLKVLDIGSRVEGYILALLANNSVKVNFGDINIPRFFELISCSYKPDYQKVDLQNLNPGSLSKYQVVSSLHVIEHLGLGKYGDKIDALGHIKVFKDVYRATSEGAYFIVSFPYSVSPGVVFNAARDCDPVDMFFAAVKCLWKPIKVAFVTDKWDLIEADPGDINSFPSAEYGCMMMLLQK